MANPVWDVGLPALNIVDTWDEDPAKLFIEEQTQGGPPKVRSNPNPFPDLVSFSQTLTKAQTMTLNTFYQTTLGGGVLPFDSTHPRTGVTTTFQFIRQPKLSPLSSGVLWRAEYDVRILP